MSDLVERLRRIPADLVYFDSEGSHETHNIGAIAKRAADEIEMLSESEIAAREGINAWRAKCMDAEARITELEAENARLREALKPFASAADPHKHMHDEGCALIQVYHLRRARAALAGQGDGK